MSMTPDICRAIRIDIVNMMYKDCNIDIVKHSFGILATVILTAKS